MTAVDLSGIIVAVAAILGFIVWGLGGKSRQNTNEAIMQENTSLRNQLGDAKLDTSNLLIKLENASKNEQIFKDIALGKPDFENLSIQLTLQHKEVIKTLVALTKAVTETRKTSEAK